MGASASLQLSHPDVGQSLSEHNDYLQGILNDIPERLDQPQLHLRQAIRSVHLSLDELRLAKLVAVINFLQRLKAFIRNHRKMPAVEDSESSEP